MLEIEGSYKIGKYMPGTLIPVLDEKKLFEDQPEYALLLSWHIADELAAKLRELGLPGQIHLSASVAAHLVAFRSHRPPPDIARARDGPAIAFG